MPCRRVDDCCRDASPTTNNPSQQGDPTLHGGRKLLRKPSSSLQTAAIIFVIWAWGPATSLAGRVHRTQACFSVGAGVEPMQRVLWGFAFGFSGPASAILSFASVASHPIVPGCLQTAGS